MIERSGFETISYVLAAAALYAVLELGLLPALLSGLLVAQLVHSVARRMSRAGLANRTLGKAIALAAVAAIVSALVALLIVAVSGRLIAGPENLFFLLERMAEAIDTARAHLPSWLTEYLPANIKEFEIAAAAWLRENAAQLRSIGSDVGEVLLYIVAGMIIGGLIAFSRDTPAGEPRPLTAALEQRAVLLGGAFRAVVFSQIRISALNTCLTALYLLVVLPLFGFHLPFLKTMIAVTFIVGLLPVIGNLVSNTVIVLVSFSVSPWVAFGSLGFLVAIHKLEYFLNARIIGTRIKARAWELLIVMLAMEAWFGLPGLVAAPIYYAYVKQELFVRNLI